MKPSDNLRLYLATAIPPPIQVVDELLSFYDTRGHHVNPPLNTVFPANWRGLRVIKRINPKLLKKHISMCKFANYLSF